MDIAVRSNAWELKTRFVLTYLWGRGLLKVSVEHLFDFKVSSTNHTRSYQDEGQGWMCGSGGGVGGGGGGGVAWG